MVLRGAPIPVLDSLPTSAQPAAPRQPPQPKSPKDLLRSHCSFLLREKRRKQLFPRSEPIAYPPAKACASLSIGFSLCDGLIDIIKFGSSVPTPAPAPDLTACLPTHPYIRQRNTARQRAHLLSTGSPAPARSQLFLHAWLQLSEERPGNLLAPKLQPRSAPRDGNGSKV